MDKHACMTAGAMIGAGVSYLLAPAPFVWLAVGGGFFVGALIADFLSVDLERNEDEV
jgi:hypothetical protein